MKHICNIILIISFLIISVESFWQLDNECDTIYCFVNTMPKYTNGISGLMDYLNKDLIPILSDCINKDSALIASKSLTLTIDREGNVIDVEFIRINATEQCKSNLKNKILTMPSWTPGKLDEKLVCCNFPLPISCILWQQTIESKFVKLDKSKKKILFVCTINRMRSATAHEIYKNDSRFEIKSAGTDSGAATVLTKELLGWADSVVVIERHHRNSIRKLYPDIYKYKKNVCLYIPDDYDYMQPELISILKYKFEDVYKKGLL